LKTAPGEGPVEKSVRLHVCIKNCGTTHMRLY
jgi:hypothetical protein